MPDLASKNARHPVTLELEVGSLGFIWQPCMEVTERPLGTERRMYRRGQNGNRESI